MAYGILKDYQIIKTVKKRLIINDKVIDYLFNELKKRKYVLRNDYNTYEEITRDDIIVFLKFEDEDHFWEYERFVILDKDPEYTDMPFEIEHASPYDHRWPGDYDPDAYDDWKVNTYCFGDLWYTDRWDHKPYFSTHKDQFDFEDEEVIIDDEEKCINIRYGWYD